MFEYLVSHPETTSALSGGLLGLIASSSIWLLAFINERKTGAMVGMWDVFDAARNYGFIAGLSSIATGLGSLLFPEARLPLVGLNSLFGFIALSQGIPWWLRYNGNWEI